MATTRVILELDEDLWAHTKSRAALEKKTAKDYVTDVLKEANAKGEKKNARP